MRTATAPSATGIRGMRALSFWALFAGLLMCLSGCDRRTSWVVTIRPDPVFVSPWIVADASDPRDTYSQSATLLDDPEFWKFYPSAEPLGLLLDLDTREIRELKRIGDGSMRFQLLCAPMIELDAQRLATALDTAAEEYTSEQHVETLQRLDQLSRQSHKAANELQDTEDERSRERQAELEQQAEAIEARRRDLVRTRFFFTVTEGQ